MKKQETHKQSKIEKQLILTFINGNKYHSFNLRHSDV